MVIPEKSRDMIRLLRERILAGFYSGGQRLPSIRMLMAEFSISNGSVKKGIDYLAEQGLLETIHGSGTFVRHSSPGNNRLEKGKSIAVFGAVNPTGSDIGIYDSVLVGMMRSAERIGCQLQLNYLPPNGLTADYIIDRSSGTDGVVFLHEIDACLEQVLLNIPAVGVCVNLPVVNSMSLVDLDPYNSALQCVEYFKQHSIDKVKIISPQQPAYRHRSVVFSAAWQAVDGSIDECWLSKSDTVEFLPDYGYLFTTCSAMQHCLSSFNQQHGKLPDNVMIGLDGKNFMEPSFYSIPAIMLDWEQAGEIAFNECMHRIDSPGRSPQRIYLSGYLRS